MTNFDFKANYVLENNAVLLRPLETHDIEHLLPFSLNEPELWRYNAGGPDNLANLEKYIAKALRHRAEGREYAFIVWDKQQRQYAGSTRFYDIQPERNTLQLGFTWYGMAFQGTGLNKNCKYLLLEFAFDKLNAARVGFGANAKNERSISAMKSIGCVVEGVLRSSGYDAKGNRIDSILLSILNSEWQTNVKDQLKSKINLKK